MTGIPPVRQIPAATIRLAVLGLVVLLAAWAISMSARKASAALS